MRLGWKPIFLEGLFYDRGKHSVANLYDGGGNGFDVVVVDMERIGSPDKRDLLKIYEKVGYCGPVTPLIDNLIKAPENCDVDDFVIEFGAPVRFGFNEILYTSGLRQHFDVPNQSISATRISNIVNYCEIKKINVELFIWDWDVPTLPHILACYGNSKSISQCYDKLIFDNDKIAKCAKEFRDDLALLAAASKGKVHLFDFADQLTDAVRKSQNCLILGFGSMSLQQGDPAAANLSAMFPSEGVLTWAECACIRGNLLPGSSEFARAKHVIRNHVLSQKTQKGLLGAQPPFGLPARKAAFDHIAKKYPEHADENAPLLVKSAYRLLRADKCKPILRQTPHPDVKVAWDSAWREIRDTINHLWPPA